MQFSICIEPFYTDLTSEERIATLFTFGFRNFEFWDWRDKNIQGMQLVLQNLPLDAKIAVMSGQRHGVLGDPDGWDEFKKDCIEETLPVAQLLGCKDLMILTCPLESDGHVEPGHSALNKDARLTEMAKQLAELAVEADKAQVTYHLEPLNTRVDHVGYFLDDLEDAVDVLKEVNHPRIRLLYDAYHMAMMGRNVVQDVNQYFDVIGHVHLADAPGRQEPGTGKMPVTGLLDALKANNYSKLVGYELWPSGEDNSAIKILENLANKYQDKIS